MIPYEYFRAGIGFTALTMAVRKTSSPCRRWPIWTYGIALWGCASKSNISVIQRYQSKLLPTITNAPWYVTNQTLHSDLRIPYVSYSPKLMLKPETCNKICTNPSVVLGFTLFEILLDFFISRSVRGKWNIVGKGEMQSTCGSICMWHIRKCNNFCL